MSERIIVSLGELVQSWINDSDTPYRTVPTQTPRPVYERLGPFSKVISGISIMVENPAECHTVAVEPRTLVKMFHECREIHNALLKMDTSPAMIEAQDALLRLIKLITKEMVGM